jgi:hypothetical protein
LSIKAASTADLAAKENAVTNALLDLTANASLPVS